MLKLIKVTHHVKPQQIHEIFFKRFGIWLSRISKSVACNIKKKLNLLINLLRLFLLICIIIYILA